MRRRLLYLTVTLFAAACLSGCQQKDPEPGAIAGYDEGEEYLSIWVHSIEDTEEGQAYKKSVETFNEAYDGQYFADIEFVPRILLKKPALRFLTRMIPGHGRNSLIFSKN